ncbi:hypothetical protein D9757_012092 [Collybiopsis confluens]|uniref:Uncharacterized protein n=1 Tax=Collybiopsis confluens TaxID=2823264 RepID=A0A8H5FXT5_9AGAR|nr:hypothetical protein D9757_012092 [Collybiopsis confluens]
MRKQCFGKEEAGPGLYIFRKICGEGIQSATEITVCVYGIYFKDGTGFFEASDELRMDGHGKDWKFRVWQSDCVVSMSQSNVNVSLERHLRHSLEPVIALIDDRALSSQVAQHLQTESIPYSVLHAVSRWSRSPAGSSALGSCSPPLDPNAYSIIALLAGTTSSPEGKFGQYIPPDEPEKIALAKKNERKAITAIVNGVLSVFGSGAAAWIGSERTNWKQEWRVLFALSVGTVVAFSEVVLYILWQSRSSTQPRARRPKYIRVTKDDSDEQPRQLDSNDEAPASGLRLRIQANSNNEE